MSKCLRICGAYSFRLSRRHSTMLLIVSFIMIMTLILQLYASRDVDVNRLKRVGDYQYRPGAFLRGQLPCENKTFCEFHYGLPHSFNPAEVRTYPPPEMGEKSHFRVIYDAITGTAFANISKYEAVTYVTHATPEFLYHILEIARFWDGPISLAVFVPDHDLDIAVQTMDHLCRCYSGMTKVSMHLFYPVKHPPKIEKVVNPYTSTTDLIPTTSTLTVEQILLQKKENYRKLDNKSRAEFIQRARQNKIKRMMLRVQKKKVEAPRLQFKDCTGLMNHSVQTFRTSNNMIYPINVARNLARNASRTNYFLVSDIEMVPSEGLAPKFLTMVRKLMGDKKRDEGCIFAKTVFVVPLFEVERGEEIPRDKDTLMKLVTEKRAVYFHQYSCPHCQRFPGMQTWLTRPPPKGIEPMIIAKREYPYHRWEPLYFGTKKEPWYSEVLSWEGQQDKMTQMLELCLQEYRMVVLDGGFLCHAAVIKNKTVGRSTAQRVNAMKYLKIVKALKQKYQDKPQCKK